MLEDKPWEEKPAEDYWNSIMTGAAPPAAAPPATSGWVRAEASYAGGETLDLAVIGHNRGGLLVDLGDVRGFVPASQLANLPRQLTEEQRMEELARRTGQTLRLKVIELDRGRNRLVLSERIASPPISRADQLFATIEPAQTRDGVIRNVSDFGAFVDLGGVEGLIHVSEMAWQHVKHPRDVVSPGQPVRVYIMDVNREQRRIACSLKRLIPNPWAQIAATVKPEDVIEGAVTSVVDFGAFVRVADGVEGLIHISELARGNFLHPRDVVQEGQNVRVRVISIEPDRQRMSLSLRLARDRASSDAGDEGAMPPPPDDGYWASLVKGDG